VAQALLTPRPLGVVFLMGPMASLTALTLAVCVSSRVNDARSAQQLAVLVVLPSPAPHRPDCGRFRGDGPHHPAHRGALAAVNLGLIRLGVSLFDREDDPHAMEVTLNEFDHLTLVAVKHARDAFVSAGVLARSGRRTASRPRPTSTRRAASYDAFLEVAHRHGAELTFAAADAPRRSTRSTPRRLARDAARRRARADGQAARAGEPAAQARAVRPPPAVAGIAGTIEPPGRSKGATSCGSTTGPWPSAAAIAPTRRGSASSRASSGRRST
jgi:hypothetical protein